MHLGSLPAAERRAVRSTYRSLRLGVAVLLTMLVTAVAVQVTRTGCVLDSLSAYYWTGAHDVVVAALCAVGALRAELETWHHAVLVTEAALVTLFAASWLLQTVELWGEGDDDQAAAAP